MKGSCGIRGIPTNLNVKGIFLSRKRLESVFITFHTHPEWVDLT